MLDTTTTLRLRKEIAKTARTVYMYTTFEQVKLESLGSSGLEALFRCVLASLQEALSTGWLVGSLVGPSVGNVFVKIHEIWPFTDSR